MGDIKLFRVTDGGVSQLEGKSAVIERTLQTKLERNLEGFLGVRLLASEYSTGKVHGGRIDSLGIDENDSPVIIEYKRSLNENVINQGLFYLDWLLDHRAEFKLLAMSSFGADIGSKINWGGTRLICIAADFTRYDQHAVSQIDRNIELLRYKSYDPDLFLLELVNSTTAAALSGDGEPKAGGSTYKTVTESLASAPPELADLYHGLDAFLLALGDVQVNPTKTYIAYRRIKNFASGRSLRGTSCCWCTSRSTRRVSRSTRLGCAMSPTLATKAQATLNSRSRRPRISSEPSPSSSGATRRARSAGCSEVTWRSGRRPRRCDHERPVRPET